MSEIGIVGAGIAGLALAKQLKARGIAFWGVEKENRVGGRLGFGHHRLYTTEGRDFLSDLLPALEWLQIDEAAIQIKKGEIEALTAPLEGPEDYYLKNPYSIPKLPTRSSWSN